MGASKKATGGAGKSRPRVKPQKPKFSQALNEKSFRAAMKLMAAFRDSLFLNKATAYSQTGLKLHQMEQLMLLIDQHNEDYAGTRIHRRYVFKALMQCRLCCSDRILSDMWHTYNSSHLTDHYVAFRWIVNALPDLREGITPERATALEAVAAKRLKTVGLVGIGKFQVIEGCGTFAGKKPGADKRRKDNVAVKIFVVCSADRQIISAKVMPTDTDDTTLLKQTNLYKQCQAVNLPSFTRSVDGREVTIPAHFCIDRQADKDDEIAKECPNLLGSSGEIDAMENGPPCAYERGLKDRINRWQRQGPDHVFAELRVRYNLFAQLPIMFRRFDVIESALLAGMKLYNFRRMDEHREAVEEGEAAISTSTGNRGEKSIRRLFKEQDMYKHIPTAAAADILRGGNDPGF